MASNPSQKRASRAGATVLLVLGLAIQPAAAAIAARVAVIKSSSIPPFDEAAAAMIEVLRGQTPQPEILTFTLDGDLRKGAGVLDEVRAAQPKVIVTIGSLATSAALNDPSLGAPVVFSMVLYPQQSGFVSRPGRGVTGASLDVPHEVQFRYLRQLLPSAQRVGVLYNPAETGAIVAAAAAAASALELSLVSETVEEPGRAVAALGRLMEKVDVVLAVADSHVFTAQTTSALILAALRAGKPLLGLSTGQVRAGALAALYTEYADVGRQTAEIVGRVLQGQNAGTIPVTQVRSVKLALNLRTAAHLGVKVATELESAAGEVVR